MVVNELRGEKIDVVEWSDDPSRFVAKALAPASVKEVRIDPETQTALVIVPDYQLSLAIGKEGQNARLAARLTGWRIDIKSESQDAEERSAPRLQPPAVEPAEAPTQAQEASASPSVTRGVPSGEVSTSVAEEGRCRAILGSGERCSNAAKPGSGYCGIPAHQKQAGAGGASG
jgi:N utilization substance protein A